MATARDSSRTRRWFHGAMRFAGALILAACASVVPPDVAEACGRALTPPPTPVPTPVPECYRCPDQCTASPCYVAGGNFITSAVDLQIRTAGLPLVVSRRYDTSRAVDGLIGHGWTSNIAAHLYYATYLYQAPSTYRKEADITMPDGAQYRYVENIDGMTYVPPDGRKDVLIKNGDGSFSLTLERSRTVYQFSPQGDLLWMRDDYGNTLNVTYDGSGRVERISDAAGSGRYIEVSYGGDGRISIIQDSAGRQVEYGYSPQGALTSVIDAAGRTTSYRYDLGRFSPLLTRVTDNWGRIETEVTYEPASDKVRTYTDQGETYTFTYNYEGTPTRTAKTDSASNRWVYNFTGTGQISSRGLWTGPFATSDFYPDGSLRETTDEVGVKTFYTYTANGSPLTVTRDYQGPLAVRFDYTYDPSFPEKVTAIAPKNPATGLPNLDWQGLQYEYYQSGDPAPGALRYVKRVRSDGTTVDTIASYVYNSRGQITQQTSATGGVTDYGYDAQTNLTSVTGPANNDAVTRPITVYVPDLLGRVEAVTDPLGKTTSYTYDNLDRMLTVTLPKPAPASPLDFVTTYSYDNYEAASTLLFTHVTDANGKTTRQGYDRYGRLVKSIDAVNNATIYGYNRDMLASILDANNYGITYGYDALRRLRSTTFSDGLQELYEYWNDGLLRTKRDRRNQTLTYIYDRHKRLWTKTNPGGGSGVTYTYTGQKLTSVLDNGVIPSETHTFGHDHSYRIETNTQASRGTIGYTYNLDDTVASYTVTGGPTATYSYYPDGSLNTIVWSPVAGQFKYTHTLRGQYESIAFPNSQTRNFTYDDQGRLTQLSNLDPGAGNLATYAYGYDLNHTSGLYDRKGQRASLTATVPAQDFNGSLTTYEYDDLYQLTKATYPNVAPFNGEVHQWTYDNIGNRLTNTVNASTLSYTYQRITGNPLNWQRLLHDGENFYGYDSNGNTQTRNGPGGNFTFGWNADDRMTSISGAVTASYRYDYQGRRSSKTTGGQTPVYLYNGLDLIRETGPATADYLFGPAIDEPLAINRGGSISYYSPDGLGSTGLLNDGVGTVQNNYVYDAWGVSRAQTEAVTNPFTYTAREKAEAGSLFYRARYLSPGVGRFLSEDSLTAINIQSLNWLPAELPDDAVSLYPDTIADPFSVPDIYAYVSNDPISYSDPHGLQKRLPPLPGRPDKTVPTIQPPNRLPPMRGPRPPGIGCQAMFRICLRFCHCAPLTLVWKVGCYSTCINILIICVLSGGGG